MMNFKKQTHSAALRTALLVSGAIATMGWSAAANSQQLEFAQKFFGNTPGNADSTQFRSTIIDPSRPGKSTAPNSTLRVIPISNKGDSPKDYACNICGIVESINITLYEGNPAEASDDDEVEDISRGSSGKGKGYVFLTRSLSETVARHMMAGQTKKPSTIYEVKVRMSDGTFRIVNEFEQPDYTVGDYVRVISGAVTAA